MRRFMQIGIALVFAAFLLWVGVTVWGLLHRPSSSGWASRSGGFSTARAFFEKQRKVRRAKGLDAEAPHLFARLEEKLVLRGEPRGARGRGEHEKLLIERISAAHRKGLRRGGHRLFGDPLRIPAPGFEKREDGFVVAREKLGSSEHFARFLERLVVEDRGDGPRFQRPTKRFRRSVVPEEKVEEHVRVDDDAVR